MDYQVNLEQFSGPLNKLLELIQEKELDITQLSLSLVTADFIKYVEGLESQVDSSNLSEFVLVASRLLLIKSRVLLPTLEFSEEEEEDIANLELRLKIYKQLCARLSDNSSAADKLDELWSKKKRSWSKPLFHSVKKQKFFYPGKTLSSTSLQSSMQRLAQVLQKLVLKKEKVEDNVISLADKIEELVSKLSQSGGLNLSGSFKEEEKQEIVVLFLAVLHMLSNQIASVEQTDHFGQIKVSSKT